MGLVHLHGKNTSISAQTQTPPIQKSQVARLTQGSDSDFCLFPAEFCENKLAPSSICLRVFAIELKDNAILIMIIVILMMRLMMMMMMGVYCVQSTRGNKPER